jgi:predicted amidohydrolase
MRDLTISLIQTTQFWEDKNKNIANFSALLKENFSSDLILLPEMFNTAFSMDAKNLAESIDLSPSLNQLKIWSSQKNAAIYTSMMVKDGEQFFNRGVFIYPNGEFVHYDKRNLFALGGEGAVFSPGKEEKTVDYLGWKINLQICFDLRFPACSANKMDKEGNAKFDLLLNVANWPEKRIGHWEKLLGARAIENQAYVAGLNRVGVDGNGLNYNGQSVVNDYNGLPILSFENNESAVRSTTLNATSLKSFRKELPFLNYI